MTITEKELLETLVAELTKDRAILLAACKEARRKAIDPCVDLDCNSGPCVYARMLDKAIAEAES